MSLNKSVINSIKAQAESILAMCQLDKNAYHAVIDLIISAEGKLIFTGMGKSGIIAQKLAATYSSTGIPSFFVHPGEAYHGDLGMIEKDDVLFAFSNSGETSELINMLKYCRSKNIIGVSRSHESTLAKYSTIHLECKIDREICPLNLAPTTSTTAALVMGDAICAAIMERRNFTRDEFAKFHPGGSLGKSLLLKARDLMKTKMAFVHESDSIEVVLLNISESRLGIVCIGNANNVIGVISDGDIRRALTSGKDLKTLKAIELANKSPKFINEEMGLNEIEKTFKKYRIASLLVGTQKSLKGIIQLYDLHA